MFCMVFVVTLFGNLLALLFDFIQTDLLHLPHIIINAHKI